MAYLHHKPDSTVIKLALYDTKRQSLAIQFHSNTVWVYMDVAIEVYDELISAESTGAYFNKHIRNIYPSERFIVGSEWNTIREKFLGKEKEAEIQE